MDDDLETTVMAAAQHVANERIGHTIGDTGDPRAFRDALGHFASGITIVAGLDGGEPVGFTCQSFCSVSLDPPLISFTVMRTSTSYPRIRRARSFSVNVLSHAQEAVSNQFARSGADKWAGVEWSPARSGNPLIAGALMGLDCDLFAEHEAGDHDIVIGRVREVRTVDPHLGEPLLYFRGRYWRPDAPASASA